MTNVTQRNIRHVQKLFQEHAQEALETMLMIMRDEGADASVRLKASNDILNRGFGTPVSTQVVMQLTEGEEKPLVNAQQIGVASTEDLQAVLATLSRYLEAEAKMVDVTPENE